MALPYATENQVRNILKEKLSKLGLSGEVNVKESIDEITEKLATVEPSFEQMNQIIDETQESITALQEKMESVIDVVDLYPNLTSDEMKYTIEQVNSHKLLDESSCIFIARIHSTKFKSDGEDEKDEGFGVDTLDLAPGEDTDSVVTPEEEPDKIIIKVLEKNEDNVYSFKLDDNEFYLAGYEGSYRGLLYFKLRDFSDLEPNSFSFSVDPMCIYVNWDDVYIDEDLDGSTSPNRNNYKKALVVKDMIRRLEYFDGETFSLQLPDVFKNTSSSENGTLSIDGVKLSIDGDYYAGKAGKGQVIKISNVYDFGLDIEMKFKEGIVRARLEMDKDEKSKDSNAPGSSESAYLDTLKSKVTKIRNSWGKNYYNISAYLDITHLQFIKYTSFTYTPKESV